MTLIQSIEFLLKQTEDGYFRIYLQGILRQAKEQEIELDKTRQIVDDLARQNEELRNRLSDLNDNDDIVTEKDLYFNLYLIHRK